MPGGGPMQTDSSAMRTCIASVSAVECTATEWMPISRAARMTRRAISPRLAIKILSNIATALFDDHQGCAILNSAAILDEDTLDRAAAWSGNMVHGLHCLNNQQRVALGHLVPDRYEGRRARLGLRIDGANHGRGYRAGVAGRIFALGGRCGDRACDWRGKLRHGRLRQVLRRRLDLAADAYV